MQKFIKALFIFIFTLAHFFILRNIFLLSKDMLTGDFSASHLIPSPRYEIKRVPDDAATQQYHAKNHLAIDFAQIYFPSQQFPSLSNNYQSGVFDPLQRPSRYPPLVHFLCSITICRLDYGIASLLHMVIQVIFFYAVFIFSFKVLKIEKDLLPGILLANCYLFLTSAGLSWFEKGQFSLYVGTAYLLLILGIVKRNNLLVILSALIAFVKWTSFPYIFVVFSLLILNYKNLAQLKKNILPVTAFLLIVFSLCLLFPSQSLNFLKGLYSQERYALPGGISMAKIVPVYIAKLLPLPLILLGFINIKMIRNGFEQITPFLAGSAILMLTYPTLAYEYNLPSLLCFIPLFFHWVTLPESPIPVPLRKTMEYSFLVFLFLASFSNYLTQRAILVMGEYFVIALILLVIPLFFYWKNISDSRRFGKRSSE